MRIIIVGSGSIIPTRDRFSSSILLETKTRKILLDIGPGTIEKLRKLGTRLEAINPILITHMHVDHVSDLLPLMKLRVLLRSGRGKMDVYGPRGFAQFMDELILKNTYFKYLAELGAIQEIGLHECWDGPVLEDRDLKISSAPVEHFNGVAYRIEADGITLVYSGDTQPDERLIRLARDVDILIHECSFPWEEKVGRHTSDLELAEITSRIKPRIIIPVHFYPQMEERIGRLENLLKKVSNARIIIPRDMEMIEV